MEFEELESIYQKFCKEKLDTLKYPDISATKYFAGFDDNPFRQVGYFLRKHDVPYTNFLRSADGAYGHLAKERKGYDNAQAFSKAQWNYYREIYNKSYTEADYLKKKYLQCLNEREYEVYYFYGLILIDSMFSTDAGKKSFEDNPEYFVKVVIIILSGRFKDLKYIKENSEEFPLLEKDEILEYLNSTLPGSNIRGQKRFFSVIDNLMTIILSITEYESIVNTIYQFESIALLEAGAKMPPVKVPCYEEGKDPIIGYEHTQINEDNTQSSVFTNIKPHQEVIYEWFGKLKEELQVKPSFWKLKEELINEGLEPEEYGLKDEPYHFNRAYNEWLKRNRGEE